MRYRYNVPWMSIIFERKYASRVGKTHYEHLEVSSKATHREVKSAYFKLSKLYHPDMNNSDEAKDKFRNILEAYEILGNHVKRKQYDRKLNLSSPGFGTTIVVDYSVYRDKGRSLTPEELRKEAERVKAEYIRHGGQNDGFPVYDTDTWTKQHYGKLFHQAQEKKQERETYEKEKQMQKKIEESSGAEITALFFLIFGCFGLLMFQVHISETKPTYSVVNKFNQPQRNMNEAESTKTK